MKKFYQIKISGESEASCTRELTKAQYELIKGIFDDCQSEYVGGDIKEVKRQYIVEVLEKICEQQYIKYDAAVILKGFHFVNENIIKYYYPSLPDNKRYFYFFDSKEEATAFADKEAKRLNCQITNGEWNETI